MIAEHRCDFSENVLGKVLLLLVGHDSSLSIDNLCVFFTKLYFEIVHFNHLLLK